MTPATNEYGQPVGPPLDGSLPAERPPRSPMLGTFCRLEPINAEEHGPDLWEAFSAATDNREWTYLPYGPFDHADDFTAWLERFDDRPLADPMLFAVIDSTSNRAVGVAAYLRIDPRSGSIEVGHIHYGAVLQQTPAATEAMYLMMRRAFETGYRRYEWKCDSLNAPSRSAAERLGFRYEGTFQKATHYKGRSRDTAWFAVVDHEWSPLRDRFEQWLSAENFDAAGRQRRRLGSAEA